MYRTAWQKDYVLNLDSHSDIAQSKLGNVFKHTFSAKPLYFANACLGLIGSIIKQPTASATAL